MEPSYDLQKYAFSEKMIRIKVAGIMKDYFLNFTLKINIEFFNRNLFFLSWIWKEWKILRSDTLSYQWSKWLLGATLEVKLVTVTKW